MAPELCVCRPAQEAIESAQEGAFKGTIHQIEVARECKEELEICDQLTMVDVEVTELCCRR